MTNNNSHSRNNTLNNSSKSFNRIRVSMNNGNLESNVLPPFNKCDDPSLDFQCVQNSQYIPVI